MLSEKVRESRDNISGLPIGLNWGNNGLGKYEPLMAKARFHKASAGRNLFTISMHALKPLGIFQCSHLDEETLELAKTRVSSCSYTGLCHKCCNVAENVPSKRMGVSMIVFLIRSEA